MKEERRTACESSAVVALETNVLVLSLKTPGWTALNYYELIDSVKSAETACSESPNDLKYPSTSA